MQFYGGMPNRQMMGSGNVPLMISSFDVEPVLQVQIQIMVRNIALTKGH